MTPHDNLHQEADRLTRRQDQLERETSTTIDNLKRDIDTVKRHVDRQRESERRDMERQFRDRDSRLRSLEQSRDNSQTLWTYLPLVVAVAVTIVLFIAVVASREQRQEPGEPQRSPSSFHAPPLGAGFAADGDTPLGFLRPGTTTREQGSDCHTTGVSTAVRCSMSSGLTSLHSVDPSEIK